MLVVAACGSSVSLAPGEGVPRFSAERAVGVVRTWLANTKHSHLDRDCLSYYVDDYHWTGQYEGNGVWSVAANRLTSDGGGSTWRVAEFPLEVEPVDLLWGSC